MRLFKTHFVLGPVAEHQVDGLQIALEDGTYAGGRVTVQPLPEQVHGHGNLRTFSLRRIEAVVSEAEAQGHIERELLKVTFQQHVPA